MPGFHASTMTNCKFPRVAHFPRLSSKNWRRGAAPTVTPFPFAYHLFMGVIQFWIVGRTINLWARCSQGSRELAPWRRLQGDSTPLLKKISLVGTWYIMMRNFITHFRLKLLSRAHTHAKNMVRHIKLLLRTKKKQKTKTYDPPSAYQQRHDPPHILPPPSSRNNERSLTTQWLACNTL